MYLPPFKLERYFARYEFNVPYLLCGSDCESLTVQELLALEPGAPEALQRHWLGYTESQGSPALRRAICGLYTHIEPDRVLVHSGAEEAIFLFMHAVLEAGDHIIAHWPCYQSLFEIARGLGCEVTFWEAREDNHWALDLDDLRRGLRPNTRAIVLNTPHNPTGYLMTPEDFTAVHRIAQEAGAILFSDEVYRETEYGSADRLPAACDLNPLAVSLGVMSKSYGLPGLRIGWIATRHAGVYDKMASLKDYTTICNSAPSEFLAELALRHRQALTHRNLGIIGDNLRVLDGFFSRHGELFSWIRPKAGPIAFPRLLGEDVETFCHELAAKAGVLLLPGTVYGDPGNHFRIGFGRKNLPEAIARMEEYLDSRG
ncbi:MAG: aminotransferase class I/II-fold pyridoxal phosphate-dependent enzyme [Bacteroidota bacterium]